MESENLGIKELQDYYMGRADSETARRVEAALTDRSSRLYSVLAFLRSDWSSTHSVFAENHEGVAEEDTLPAIVDDSLGDEVVDPVMPVPSGLEADRDNPVSVAARGRQTLILWFRNGYTNKRLFLLLLLLNYLLLLHNISATSMAWAPFVPTESPARRTTVYYDKRLASILTLKDVLADYESLAAAWKDIAGDEPLSLQVMRRSTHDDRPPKIVDAKNFKRFRPLLEDIRTLLDRRSPEGTVQSPDGGVTSVKVKRPQEP